MFSDPDVVKCLDTSSGHVNKPEKIELECQMGFRYRAATDGFLFGTVTCHPDISNALIQLTQFTTNPKKCHHEALMRVFRYLNDDILKALYVLIDSAWAGKLKN